MTEFEAARRREHMKYVRAYASANYRMGDGRRLDAIADLSALPVRGSYLDVGCGRGEMLDEAERLGFSPVQGTEIVPALIDGQRVVYAEAHALPFPDKSFNVVTMFDVLEHLLRGDDYLALLELTRVARRHIIVAVNNDPSVSESGDELHINRRSYDDWDRLLRAWLSPWPVTRIRHPRHFSSARWRIDLA